MCLVLGLGLDHSCSWPREGLSLKSRSLTLFFFFFESLALALAGNLVSSTPTLFCSIVKLQKRKGELLSTVLNDCQKNSQLLTQSAKVLCNLKIAAISLPNTRKLQKFHRFESVQNRENTASLQNFFLPYKKSPDLETSFKLRDHDDSKPRLRSMRKSRDQDREHKKMVSRPRTLLTINNNKHS